MTRPSLCSVAGCKRFVLKQKKTCSLLVDRVLCFMCWIGLCYEWVNDSVCILIYDTEQLVLSMSSFMCGSSLQWWISEVVTIWSWYCGTMHRKYSSCPRRYANADCPNKAMFMNHRSLDRHVGFFFRIYIKLVHFRVHTSSTEQIMSALL